VNLEELSDKTPKEHAELYVTAAANCWAWYEPLSFWSYQPCYIEMAVEKTDLRILFEKVCAEYRVPVWNAGGWSDINSRADLMKRFQRRATAGRCCVLLYCGDFDPAGLLISDTIRENLRALQFAVRWFPRDDQLVIDRFGLNEDFIEDNNLLWIDGLETGGGKYNLEDPRHPDHKKPYVQDYLKKYGARKVESNALVAHFEAGRHLCREAILKYIDPDGIKRYEKALQRERGKVRKALPHVLRGVLDNGNGKEAPR
jgi:hypothetical protein